MTLSSNKGFSLDRSSFTFLNFLFTKFLNLSIFSVLIGKDGSAIKSIAFNAVDNDLGSYLIKKNNKIFNIAGKLSLNEWKGQSNVEFIIDDISVNKTFKNTVPSSIG